MNFPKPHRSEQHNFMEGYQKVELEKRGRLPSRVQNVTFKVRCVLPNTYSPQFSMSGMVFKHIFVNHRAVVELGQESDEVAKDDKHENTGRHHSTNLNKTKVEKGSITEKEG